MTEDMSSQDTTAVETAENTVETVVGNADEQASNQDVPSDFEPLTATYERLRHSTDAAELSEFAPPSARLTVPNRPLFSRATALLEAVAAMRIHVGRSRFSCGNHAVSEYSRQTVHRRIR